ncbi:MAG: hypothetical protein Q8O23_01735 [Gallionella sp.]|nr:hypothetical protein [Gallionella sp.]
MATQAGLVARFNRSGRTFGKGAIRQGPVAALVVDVRGALTVAIGAGRRTAVACGAVARLADGKHVFFILVVAARALCITLENEILIVCRCGLGRYCDTQRQSHAEQHGGKGMPWIFLFHHVILS